MKEFTWKLCPAFGLVERFQVYGAPGCLGFARRSSCRSLRWIGRDKPLRMWLDGHFAQCAYGRERARSLRGSPHGGFRPLCGMWFEGAKGSKRSAGLPLLPAVLWWVRQEGGIWFDRRFSSSLCYESGLRSWGRRCGARLKLGDPEVNTFLDSLPGNGWWDWKGGCCFVADVAERAFEPPAAPSAFRFLSVVFRTKSDEWSLWGTCDLERHRSVPKGWRGLVHCKVAAFFTRHGPAWAGWLPGSATSGLGMSRGLRSEGVNTVANPCLPIVESVGFERMGEETPTDYYYEELRKDLGQRHPKADPFLLDHLVSLEGFLDKSIVFGFSFGVSKAELCVESGKLLGHLIGRQGMHPDPPSRSRFPSFEGKSPYSAIPGMWKLVERLSAVRVRTCSQTSRSLSEGWGRAPRRRNRVRRFRGLQSV